MPLRSLIEELRDFDTALIANTIGHIDPTPTHTWYMGSSIQSVTPTLAPTVGVAVTIELDSSTPGGKPDPEGFWKQLEQMQAMDEPAVWVVKCYGSRPEHECTMGDGMAKLLQAAGCVGVVTDGGVRDVPGLLATPLAAYCRGVQIHHECLRYRNLNQPVEIGGITVTTGDVIHANAEGVIKIPKSALDGLPGRATKMRAAEHDIHRVWRRTDLSIAEKRRVAATVFAEYGFGGSTARQHEIK